MAKLRLPVTKEVWTVPATTVIRLYPPVVQSFNCGVIRNCMLVRESLGNLYLRLGSLTLAGVLCPTLSAVSLFGCRI